MDDNNQVKGMVPPYKDLDKEPNPAAHGPKGRLVLSQEQQDQLIRMSEVGCSVKEMCTILGVVKDRDTLVKHYGELIQYGKMAGNNRLRRVQYQKAVEEGNVQMLMWLGKQRLGQSEDGKMGNDEPLPWQD